MRNALETWRSSRWSSAPTTITEDLLRSSERWLRRQEQTAYVSPELDYVVSSDNPITSKPSDVAIAEAQSLGLVLMAASVAIVAGISASLRRKRQKRQR